MYGFLRKFCIAIMMRSCIIVFDIQNFANRGELDMLQEFKDFALKGNVLDLAIAVVMGAAFNKIVTSLVENIIMPLIGLLFGEVDFAKNWSMYGIKYGIFIQSIIDFIIIAFALFIFVKIANTVVKPKEEEVVVEENIVLLTEIRDLLRKDSK